MTAESLHAIERVHGWVAIASTVALAWAAWRVVKRPAGALPAGLGAAAAATLSGALGLALEATYRTRLRARLFARSPELGWLFERKEHLAFGAIALAWAAVFALAARRAPPNRAGADLERAARRALVASALLAVASSAASIVVGQFQRL